MLLETKEFYDYKTAPVSGDNVIDNTKTGMSFYDDFLDPSQEKYLWKEKNLKGRITLMSPQEYFQACSDYGFPGSHPSVESLKQQRRVDTNTLEHLKDVLTVYKKRFPMPVLNKAEAGQEGLHRMMVIGDMFGWDHKVPVLVVDWADKQRAFDKQKKDRQNRIEYNIKRAVQETLRYKFRNIDEMRDQLQWELDKQFEYNSDDIKIPVRFDLKLSNNEFTVEIGAAKFTFDYSDVNFVDEIDDDDIDIEDIDLEETEDFLKRYFGDDWRDTHPHLRDTFNLK